MKLKQVFKKNQMLMWLYNKLLPYYCIYFTKSAVKMLYKQTFQRELNLDNPRDLNEKINWLKIHKYKNDPLVIQCADKWRVREYVKGKNCDEILNEIYAVYYTRQEVKIENLPTKFVLKFNKGAGLNYICEDKANISNAQLQSMMKKWFRAECGERFGELHYRKAKPCIICEKYLGDENGNYPVDYKFFVFSGKVHAVMICVERKEKVKFLYVDNQYNRLDYTANSWEEEKLPSKPKCFDEMIMYAEKLAAPFCHVRVDFYVFNNKPILGEMTFTSNGGFDKYANQRALDIMGDLLVLPEK